MYVKKIVLYIFCLNVYSVSWLLFYFSCTFFRSFVFVHILRFFVLPGSLRIIYKNVNCVEGISIFFSPIIIKVMNNFYCCCYCIVFNI